MNLILYWLTRNRRILDFETFDRIDLHPILPLWVTLIVAVLVVATAIYLYRRVKGISPRQRATLAFLRATAYLALLFIVMAPRLDTSGVGRPEGPLPIVLDRTTSMTIRDVGEQTRLDAARSIDAALLAEADCGQGLLQHGYLYGEDVMEWNRTRDPHQPTGLTARVQAATEDAASSSPALIARGERTSLPKMIDGALHAHRGVYTPGLLLLSDGAHNTAEFTEPTVAALKKRGIPVYFLPLGQERPRDIALDHIIGEDIVFVSEKFKAFVSMRQSGYTGLTMPVQASFGGTPLTTPDCRPEKDGETVFAVEHTPLETGVFELAVEIPPAPREINTKNNRIARKVRVIKDRIRILLVFGEPGWEYRFLSGAFDRDRRVKYSVYLQTIDPRILEEKQERFVARLPTTEEELFRAYDMVIVGDIDTRTLPEDFAKLVKAFVSKEGGGLVIVSDDRHIPYCMVKSEWDDMLPITLADGTTPPASFRQEMFSTLAKPSRLRIAEEGHGSRFVTFDADQEKNAAIWAKFPLMFEPCPPAELKPSAILLVENVEAGGGEPQPAIAYHNYGHGIVLYMGFDSTWRWRKEQGDRYFRDYWGKIVQFMGLPHMLGGQAQSRILLDRIEAGVGDRVLVTAQVRNPDYTPLVESAVTLSVTLPDNSVLRLELPAAAGRPGLYRTAFYPEQEGTVTFALDDRLMADDHTLDVVRINPEFRESGMNLQLMTDVARKTGGAVFMPHEPAVTNAPPAAAGPHADATELRELADRCRAEGRHPLADQAYIRRLARHVLQTISERRPSTPLEEASTLWDTTTMLMLAAGLLCVEYFLRKRWYLD